MRLNLERLTAIPSSDVKIIILRTINYLSHIIVIFYDRKVTEGR
jgi:hypothetical protein